MNLGVIVFPDLMKSILHVNRVFGSGTTPSFLSQEAANKDP